MTETSDRVTVLTAPNEILCNPFLALRLSSNRPLLSNKYNESTMRVEKEEVATPRGCICILPVEFNLREVPAKTSRDQS